ncbi:MAG: protein-L-isoaspartate(D-aspartate) O-methyltransferase [bacterium]
MKDLHILRQEMVKNQLIARGIRDQAVLEAMREVPREEFVPESLAEFAYEDAPLPIGEGQTISQPYVVALMLEKLELSPGDRVLEIGTGSGYSSALLSRIAGEVYTVERLESLVQAARERFLRLGYENIHSRHSNGTLGWPEHAPYDAVIVTAGSPSIPDPLREQLAVGGRMIIPIGSIPRLQALVLMRRLSEHDYRQENFGTVQFVPLIGAAGWGEPRNEPEEHELQMAEPQVRLQPEAPPQYLSELIRKSAEPIYSIVRPDLSGLLNRIGSARLVLMGEASHGTAEFYELRARITQELIIRKGFTIVAVEADWPDAAWINHYIQDTPATLALSEERPFSRFPGWTWANTSMLSFIEWLRHYNQTIGSVEQTIGFYGLDLYSLYSSIAAVLRYLDSVDSETARIARQRYGCLSPWEHDPAAYGAAALSDRYKECESEMVAMLQDLMRKRMEYAARDSRFFFDEVQKARLIANAGRYYRLMYYGSVSSWNLRDHHLFETLKMLLDVSGPSSRAVVWAHNSHLGDASATEMGAQGEYNVGQLCRKAFGEEGVYLIGFGTDHGTVAAASNWDGPMEVMNVRPAHPESYERLCHDSRVEAFFLPLKSPSPAHSLTPLKEQLKQGLLIQRLERAIGAVYRPETEILSHYFHASLPRQFDEYVWFDETRAVTPLGPEAARGMPETFPFGV